MVSSPILFEVAKVLRYPRLLDLHGLREHDIYQYVGYLREVAVAIPLDLVIPVPIRDANDVMVAHTAIVGEAEYLCTTDRDFFDERTLTFLARFGITVLTDVGLMQRLRSMPV